MTTREEIAAEVRKLVVEQQESCHGSIRTPIDQITDDATFDALGFDSLDNVEFILAVEERYEIDVPDGAAENIQTVGQAVDYLAGKLAVGA